MKNPDLKLSRIIAWSRAIRNKPTAHSCRLFIETIQRSQLLLSTLSTSQLRKTRDKNIKSRSKFRHMQAKKLFSSRLNKNKNRRTSKTGRILSLPLTLSFLQVGYKSGRKRWVLKGSTNIRATFLNYSNSSTSLNRPCRFGCQKSIPKKLVLALLKSQRISLKSLWGFRYTATQPTTSQWTMGISPFGVHSPTTTTCKILHKVCLIFLTNGSLITRLKVLWCYSLLTNSNACTRWRTKEWQLIFARRTSWG